MFIVVPRGQNFCANFVMDEETREKTKRFAQMQKDCTKVLEAVKAYVDQQEQY